MPKQGEDLGIDPGKEARHCFKQEAHTDHIWHERYWCSGAGIDPNSMKVREDPWGPVVKLNPSAHDVGPAPEVATPAILDGRTAYGDKVINQVEQADMINAYLSGRKVRPVDVPIIMVLIKLHRIGKMPDYADSYDDVDGYMSIARSVIGPDMIQATTAKEYMEIKNRGHQGEGRTINSFIEQVNKQAYTHPSAAPRHPYENVERDDIRDMGLDEDDHRL